MHVIEGGRSRCEGGCTGCASKGDALGTLSTDELAELYAQAKEREAAEKALRLMVEEELVDRAKNDGVYTDAGTITLTPRLKVVTGYTRKWDQEKLTEIIGTLCEEELHLIPFVLEHKEHRELSKLTEDHFPDLWAKLEPALTIHPRKPAFTLKSGGGA